MKLLRTYLPVEFLILVIAGLTLAMIVSLVTRRTVTGLMAGIVPMLLANHSSISSSTCFPPGSFSFSWLGPCGGSFTQ